MAEKKSFLLYFDMYPSIRRLSPEQKGYLLSALFEFADGAWREELNKEAILERFPQLDEVGRMAYSFIAETIQRDTEKWREKQKHYQKAAQERNEKNCHDNKSTVSRHMQQLQKERPIAQNDDIWKYV